MSGRFVQIVIEGYVMLRLFCILEVVPIIWCKNLQFVINKTFNQILIAIEIHKMSLFLFITSFCCKIPWFVVFHMIFRLYTKRRQKGKEI